MYDFTLQVGDTMSFGVAYTQTVLSIDTVLVCGSYRKVYNAGAGYAYDGSRSWIEGIGSTHGLFAPCLLEFECGGNLICYEDSFCFWQHPNSPVCYTIGVENEIDIPILSVYPNPADNYLRFKDDGQMHAIRIYDLTGKEVIKGNFRNTIDLSTLQEGIYVLMLETQHGTQTQKIVIQR